MGCVNSSHLPAVLENGEHVAPPYDLKQAGDKLTQEGQGLIGTAKRMFSPDNMTSKLKETADDIVDSNPVQNVIGGAVAAKDAAVSKIHGAGETVKQTIGSFTHQTEEKFGSFAHGVEEKLGGVIHGTEEKIGSAMSHVGETLDDLLPSKTPPSSPVHEEPMVEEVAEHVEEPDPEPEPVDPQEETEAVNQENGEVDEMVAGETTEEGAVATEEELLSVEASA